MYILRVKLLSHVGCTYLALVLGSTFGVLMVSHSREKTLLFVVHTHTHTQKWLSSSSLLIVTVTHIDICAILFREAYLLFLCLKKLNSLSLMKPSSKNWDWECCIKIFSTRLLLSLLTTMTENYFNFFQCSFQRALLIYLTFPKSWQSFIP